MGVVDENQPIWQAESLLEFLLNRGGGGSALLTLSWVEFPVGGGGCWVMIVV